MAASNCRPINVLSIDGGASGLSALYLLEEIFSRLKFDLKSDEELCPSEYFDIIGGSGPGALIALLLGRLQMTVSQAIQGYMKLVPALSVPPTDEERVRKANSAAFEQTFREILQDAEINSDSPLLDESSPKTLVFTLDSASMAAPYILRSYRSRTSGSGTCSILQAACACVASPNKFATVTIGEAHQQVTCVDATIGYANPIIELLQEAKELFDREVKVATIVSIGAEMKPVSASVESREAGIHLRVNADCERIHEGMQTRLGESCVYHRFKANSVLEESQKDTFGHVSAYLRQGIISSAVDAVIKSVQTRAVGPSLLDITSVTPVEITLKPRPSLVRNFVGREDILQAMHRTHFNIRPGDMSGPAITALTGLGGSGKTQIALKFALEYEDQHPDAPVYFVDGSKETTLKTDLETIIRSQGPNHRSDSYEDALIWLATKSKEWLLIVDNVDDPSLKLSSFIPRCSHGHVIVTTRDATRKILAPRSTHVVEGLSMSDAIILLLETAGYEFNSTNQTYAKEIVDELGHLPLALSHASAYISVHQCLSIFLSTYRQSRAHLLETSPDLLHNYPYSVATTIQMSLDKLSPTARNLLRVFAHLDARSIAYAVLAEAAENSFRRVEKASDEEVQPETVEQADILMKIFCPSQKLVPAAFNDIIATCLHYSLLKVVTRSEERFYSMHVLIQGYLKDDLRRVQGQTFPRLITRLLGSAVPSSNYYYDQLAFKRLLFPHIRLIGVENVIEAGDHYGLGGVLYEMGDGRAAIVHLERCMEQWKQAKGENDLCTLAAMTRLGYCYYNVGNEEKALEIRERVVEISRRVLGEEDLETLANIQGLAGSYYAAGRHQEALDLSKIVLEKRKKLLGDDHRHTLDAMNNLAVSYWVVGREQEALELRETVLEKTRDLLGNEHRDTLMAIGNLANSYSTMGRELEAVPMYQLVLPKFITNLGQEHIHTLFVLCQLAQVYRKLGMLTELEELRHTTLPLHRMVLDADRGRTKPLDEGDIWAMLRTARDTINVESVADGFSGDAVSPPATQTNGGRMGTLHGLPSDKREPCNDAQSFNRKVVFSGFMKFLFWPFLHNLIVVLPFSLYFLFLAAL